MCPTPTHVGHRDTPKHKDVRASYNVIINKYIVALRMRRRKIMIIIKGLEEVHVCNNIKLKAHTLAYMLQAYNTSYPTFLQSRQDRNFLFK